MPLLVKVVSTFRDCLRGASNNEEIPFVINDCIRTNDQPIVKETGPSLHPTSHFAPEPIQNVIPVASAV